MKITLLYQVSHYIRVKKQRNIKSWDQQNYLVIRGFCYIRPRYNEVPLYKQFCFKRSYAHVFGLLCQCWLFSCLFLYFFATDMRRVTSGKPTSDWHRNTILTRTQKEGWVTNQQTFQWTFCRAHGIMSLTRFPAHGRMLLSQCALPRANDIMPCALPHANDIMPCAQRVIYSSNADHFITPEFKQRLYFFKKKKFYRDVVHDQLNL